jgi:dolichol-phosphate mannosyltransferase
MLVEKRCMRVVSGMDLIRNGLVYIRRRKWVIGKFLVISGSAVLINLLLLFVMVRWLGLSSRLGENVANAVSMELSIIYNFFLSRAITWNDRYKERGRQLFIQATKFHIAIGFTILLRLVLFAALQMLDVFYIVNAAIGILVSATFNFVVYDTVVFRRRA